LLLSPKPFGNILFKIAHEVDVTRTNKPPSFLLSNSRIEWACQQGLGVGGKEPGLKSIWNYPS